MAPPRTPIKERLLARRRIDGECWIYTGPVSHDGYGVIGVGRGRQVRAHRAAYEVFIGPIPSGALICHRCDTPLCFNPLHLFAGTPRENTRDMIAKGRKAVVRPNLKVPADRLSEIRARRSGGETLKAIAADFGICFQHVSAICKGARG